MIADQTERRCFMKSVFTLICILAFLCPVSAQNVFINEIRANDSGTDDAEFIEIIGPAGTDISGWTLIHYNGSGATVVFSYSFPGGAVIPDDGVIDQNGVALGFIVVKNTGHTVLNADYDWGNAGLQNGPDGIELLNNDAVRVQALTWNGLGDLSDGNPSWRNIGSDTNTDNSLCAPDSMQEVHKKAWISEDPTPGILNTGQSSGDISLPVEVSIFRAVGGDGIVYLYWQTISEIDHQGFIIERAAAENGLFYQIASYESNDQLRGIGNTSRERNYRYSDRTVYNNLVYWYRLVDVDMDGIRTLHTAVFALPSAQVKQIDTYSAPHSFKLLPNYPNPFNPTTKIRFEIPGDAVELLDVQLSIFDISGSKITTLVDNLLLPGRYETVWDGRDRYGNQVASGIYISVFSSRKYYALNRMVLIR
jgi:hypothetical protein